jgi:hypothetical protein
MRLGVTAKFNVGVLLQVAGLLCLFRVPHPENLAGWLLIVGGGVLYRLALKERRIKAAGPDMREPRR